MNNPWIVFGGWAIPPDILAPIFGTGARYIDSNHIVPSLLCGDRVAEDWQIRLHHLLKPYFSGKEHAIAGWSMGSLLAAAACACTDPSMVCMFSATHRFCRTRTKGFEYGVYPLVLQKMRKKMETNPDQVIREFLDTCGPIPQIHLRTPTLYSPHQLRSGLLFLEQAFVEPEILRFKNETLFFHGNQDCIIPMNAGKYFCILSRARFLEFEGGHTFFLKSYSEIKNIIEGAIHVQCSKK